MDDIHSHCGLASSARGFLVDPRDCRGRLKVKEGGRLVLVSGGFEAEIDCRPHVDPFERQGALANLARSEYRHRRSLGRADASAAMGCGQSSRQLRNAPPEMQGAPPQRH
jgi:hypothetical protein